jgi:hypothetical protein
MALPIKGLFILVWCFFTDAVFIENKPTVLTGTELELHKRTSTWDIVADNQQCAVVLAGASTWYKLTDVSIKNNFKAGKYTGLVGTAIWLTAAAILSGSHHGTITQPKRDETYLYSNDYEIDVDSFINEMLLYGVNLSNSTYSLEKRDELIDEPLLLSGYINNAVTNYTTLPVLLDFTIIAEPKVAVGSSSTLVSDMVDAHPLSQSSKFVKRGTNYWVSYNYDKTDVTYAKPWLDAYENNSLDFWNDIGSWLYYYGSYKMCIAAQLGPDQDSFDQVGLRNAFKGELYIEQFGGMDNQCIDDKDGTDM